MSTKFNKRILLQVPTTDKDSKLLLEVGTNGYVMINEGTAKVGVLIKDLEEALHEARVLSEVYKVQPKAVGENTKTDFTNLEDDEEIVDLNDLKVIPDIKIEGL